jgi:HlyD family secretion protein
MSNLPIPRRSQLPAYPIAPEDDEMDDRPSRELRIGAVVAGLFFVGLLGWSFVARMDVAAYANGSIAVEGHRQTIQHKDGGTVAAIFVKEGDQVAAGQVLIALAPTVAAASEQSMASQLIDLEAERARLMAEQQGLDTIATPPELAALTGPDKDEAERALAFQQREMQARRSATAAQKTVLSERGEQLARAIEGYQSQIASVDEQSRLIGDELKGTQSLAARGYAPENRVRALQRDAAGLKGQKGDLTANAARSQAQIGEIRMQSMSVDTDRSEAIAKDLRDVNFQIDDLLPKLAPLKEALAQTKIRAPVSGQVVGLQVFTVGGVVGPGEKLMDIVPKNAPMVIDAQIPANNMDGLYVGQSTEVRITSMHDRRLPILRGTITELSADSMVDEKSGARYYTMEVTVPEAEAKKIDELRGPNGGLRIGLPVQVVVPLRKRSAWQYLTEPLTQSFGKAFRER